MTIDKETEMGTTPTRRYEATVTDPDTGDKHTFTAATEDALEDAIEAYFGGDDTPES